MRYTVTWDHGAEEELAQIWMDALDRQAVTDAAYRIDRRLRSGSADLGWPYEGNRVLFDEPLAVTFVVSPDDCLVKVLQVRRSVP